MVKMPRQSGEIITTNFSSGYKFLARHGFCVVFFNTVFGLLSVTWNQGRITCSACSFASLYTIIFFSAMIYGSTMFSYLSYSIHYTSMSIAFTATDLAIGLARSAHIVGFFIIVLRGTAVARAMPKIWTSLAILAQRSSLHSDGMYIARSKLKRFVWISIVVYFASLVLKEANIIFVKQDMFIADFADRYGPMIPENEFHRYWLLLAGYVVWDCTTVSHGLTCMLLAFLVAVVHLCIKSINLDIKSTVEKWVIMSKMSDGKAECSTLSVIDIHGNSRKLEASSWDDIERKFDEIKESYRQAETLMDKLSAVFGASLATEQFIVTTTMVANTFCLYCQIFYKLKGCSRQGEQMMNDTAYDALIPLQDAFAHTFFFVCLSVMTTKAVNQSRKSVQILKLFPYEGARNPEMRTMLRDFQNDIESTRIVLTASDCFTVNKQIMKRVVGSVMTFVVVLMQFQYQEKGYPPCVVNGTLSTDTVVPSYRDSV